jgi:hypothetical protein
VDRVIPAEAEVLGMLSGAMGEIRKESLGTETAESSDGPRALTENSC